LLGVRRLRMSDLEVRGSTFEVIPEHLVVRARLLAAAELVDDTPAGTTGG